MTTTAQELESNLYFYRAKCLKVVDGDTLEIDFDLGLSTHRHPERVRLHGLNTPEIHGVKHNSDIFKAGLAASAFVCSRVVPKELGRTLSKYADQLVTGEPRPLWVETIRDKEGKYGRYLAKIWLVHETDDRLICLNDELVTGGFAEAKVY